MCERREQSASFGVGEGGRLSTWWSRAFGSRRPAPSEPAPRRSRASSFHLWWELPSAEPLLEVAATLEVVKPPTVDRLYFWALQASFAEGHARLGGGHLGLQWNPRHPEHGAVNWGGYASQAYGGDILDGSVSVLPSSRNDRNTRDYPWQPGRAYRLRIFAAPDRPGAWRGEVTDLTTGDPTVVRDLYAGGDRLAAPVVWTEVFAECDHPSVAVRWSDLQATAEGGSPLLPVAVRVNYQLPEHGGCPNTNVTADEVGILQTTTVERTTPQGAVLMLQHTS